MNHSATHTKNKDEPLPDYLEETYRWAYLNPKTVPILSSSVVVQAILWGNASRLIRAACSEVRPGDHVLQPACVYGRFSEDLADATGKNGRLSVMDVAPIQLETAKKRLSGKSWAKLSRHDASTPYMQSFDCVVCFFLLHEVPDTVKQEVVTQLLNAVKPGGKVVFVDYHKPHKCHPLKPVMSAVFHCLEPFAKGLWRRDIADFAPASGDDHWHKETFFGGLYQKVVVRRAP